MTYTPAKGHKAMAIAPNGALGIAVGLTDRATAERQAIDSCNEWSKYVALRKPPVLPCEVLASDSDWKIPTLHLSDDWQRPATGKDQAMRKGRRYLVKNSKGIVLHVHGCDGMGDAIFSDVWGAYFNALGYDLYVPNSFAVKRPKHACGDMYDYPARQSSDIWRLRVAQTQRTLADLQAANPGKPVFLWGHSEGGLVVQMMQARPAGIIVSGEECGALGNPIAAYPEIPLLYIWGEYDTYVNGLGNFKVTDASGSICAARMPGRKLWFEVVRGRTHNPWPWNYAINAAVAKFLNSDKAPEISALLATAKNFKAWKLRRAPKNYRTAKLNRAAAINKAGTAQMVWGLDNEQDARHLALFGCSNFTSRSTNVFKTGLYKCVLVDVNGEAPR